VKWFDRGVAGLLIVALLLNPWTWTRVEGWRDILLCVAIGVSIARLGWRR
jgi:hypothetical protein